MEHLREAGDVVQLVSKTHCAQNMGWRRRPPTTGCAAQCATAAASSILAGDRGGRVDVACVALDRGVRFLLMGDFRQLRALLDSFAGARVERPLKDSDLLRDLLAGGCCHELTENRRSDERIFQFISWLRVGEADEVPLAEAVRLARREFPAAGGRTPTCAWCSPTRTACRSTSGRTGAWRPQTP